MKKIGLIIIFTLILATSIVKNSTKELEDKIFVTSENIRSLKVEYGDVMLEYNYLSSPEKLVEYQSQYFEDYLIMIDVNEIKQIQLNENYLEITNLTKKNRINE